MPETSNFTVDNRRVFSWAVRRGRNLNVTISISTFKIGSGRAERKVSPDCRPPSIITAPKHGKIPSEPCGYREKVA